MIPEINHDFRVDGDEPDAPDDESVGADDVDMECSALVDELSDAVDSLLANKAVEWDSMGITSYVKLARK